MKVKAKYHFIGGTGTFWEREPFAWAKEGGQNTAQVCRGICLGEMGNKTKERVSGIVFSTAVIVMTALTRAESVRSVVLRLLHHSARRTSSSSSERDGFSLYPFSLIRLHLFRGRFFQSGHEKARRRWGSRPQRVWRTELYFRRTRR